MTGAKALLLRLVLVGLLLLWFLGCLMIGQGLRTRRDQRSGLALRMALVRMLLLLFLGCLDDLPRSPRSLGSTIGPTPWPGPCEDVAGFLDGVPRLPRSVGSAISRTFSPGSWLLLLFLGFLGRRGQCCLNWGPLAAAAAPLRDGKLALLQFCNFGVLPVLERETCRH